MARPNLLKIDDLLLRMGTVLGLLWLLGLVIGLAVSLEARGSLTAGLLAVALLAASAPVGLIVAGLRLRRRENRAWALHRLIDDHVEIGATDLLRGSDFTAHSLDRAIRDLSNAGVAILVWDRRSDLIQDGRLRRAQLQIDECASCGAKVSLTVRIGDAATVRCPYCHGPLNAEQIQEEKARLIDELDGSPRQDPSSSFLSPDFSIPIFIALSVVFWPFGLAYVFKHWRAARA